MAQSVSITLLLRDNVSRRMGAVNDSFRRLSRELGITKRNSTALGSTLKTFSKLFAKPYVAVGLLTAGLSALSSALSVAASAATTLASSLGPALAASFAGLVGILGAAAQGMFVVKYALKGVGAALNGNKKAFDKLTPAAQAWVKLIRDDLAPAFNKLKENMQEHFFDGLHTEMKKTATEYLPMMDKAFTKTADVFNKFAKKFLQLARTKEWKSDFGKITASNNRILDDLGYVALSLANILKDLWVAMGPLVERFSEWLKKSAHSVEVMTQQGRASGKLEAFFKRAGDQAAQWGRIIGNTTKALFNIFKVGQKSGRSFTDSLEDVTEKWKKWTESAGGKNRISKWFDDGNKRGKEFKGLLGDLKLAYTDAFQGSAGQNSTLAGAGLASANKEAGSLIKKIRAEWIPAIRDLMIGFAQSGALESFIELISKWLQILADIAKSNALGIIIGGLNSFATAVQWLMDNVPGVTAVMQVFFGAMLALAILNWTGLTGLIVALVSTLWTLVAVCWAGVTASGGLSASLTAMGARMGLTTAFMNGLSLSLLRLRLALLNIRLAAAAAWTALMGPVGLVVLAIAAVIAVFVLLYMKVGWFRTAVNTAVHAVGQAFVWLYQNAILPAWNGIKIALIASWPVIKTIFSGIVSAVRWIGTAMMWLWTTIIQPVWNFIRAFLGARIGELRDILRIWVVVIKSVGAAFMWLWHNAIVPAWNGIKAAIIAAWPVIRPVLLAILSALRPIANAVLWLWHNVMVPAWTAISAVVSANSGKLRAIWNALVIAVKAVGSAMSWLWRTIIVPAWNAISSVMTTKWGLLKVIFNSIKAAIKAVASVMMWLWKNIIEPVWKGISSAITRAWSGNTIKTDLNAMIALLKVVGKWMKWLYDNIIKPVWTGIKNAISSNWSKIKAIFNLFVAGIKAVGKIATWLWKNIVSPAWNGIKNVISSNWGKIKTIFNLVVAGLKLLGKWCSWLWKNVVVPAWNGIKKVISDNWNKIKTTWNLVVAGIKLLGKTTTWLWKNVITPAWNGIKKVISDNWNRIKAIWALIDGGIKKLRDGFNWLKARISEIWSGIKKTLSDSWNWINKNIFDKMMDVVKNKIPAAFKTAKESIAKIWNGIKDAAMAPVKWVVNTVYNDKLRGFVGTVLDKGFGVKKNPLPAYTMATGGIMPGGGGGYAHGGVLPGYSPGRDNMVATSNRGPVHLSGGEAIMRPEWTRAVGADGVDSMNALARKQGVSGLKKKMGFAHGGVFTGGSYAHGGIHDPSDPLGVNGRGYQLPAAAVKSIVDKGSSVGEAAKFVKSKVLEGAVMALWAPIGKIVNPLLDGLIKNGGAMGQIGGGAGKQIIDGILNWLVAKTTPTGGDLGDVTYSNASARLSKALTWARSQAGKPYQWGGGGNPSWDCSGFIAGIQRVIQGQTPGRLYTTHSFMGGSPPSGWVRNLSSPFTTGVSTGHMAGSLLGVNVESSSSGRGVRVGPSARGTNHSMFTRRFGYKPVVKEATPGGSGGGTKKGGDAGDVAGGAGAVGGAAVGSINWFKNIIANTKSINKTAVGGGFSGAVGSATGAGACKYTSFGGGSDEQPTASGRSSKSAGMISTNNYPLNTVMDLWGPGGRSARGMQGDHGPAAFVQRRYGSQQLIDLGPDMAKKILGAYGGNGSGRFKVVKMGSGKTFRQLQPAGFARGGVFEDHGGLYSEASASMGGILRGYSHGGRMKPHEIGVVGEQGPELFFAGRHGGDIIPNGATAGDSRRVHITIPDADGDITVNFNGPVFVKNSIEFRKMVVTAINEAKRKGEIRQ